MTTSNPCLNPVSSNSNTVVLPHKNTDRSSNVLSRANLLAKAIVRDIAIPESSIQFLFGTTQPEPNGRADVFGSVQLIEDLFHSAGINDPSSQGAISSLEKTLCQNLASSLQDLFRATKGFTPQIQSQWILQALMPLYLSAGEGRLGDGLRNVLQGLRTLWSISELGRVLGSEELGNWISESHSSTEISALTEKTFAISLSELTFGIWSELHVAVDRDYSFSIQSPRPAQDERSQVQLREAQWKLVTQFVRGDSPIHVPAEVVVGNVAWDKLISHWKNLEQSLLNRRPSASALLPGSQLSKSLPKSKKADRKESKPLSDSRFIEIRSARDPQLSSNLDQLLSKARSEQTTLSILVVKKLDCATANDNDQGARLQNWQSKLIQLMDKQAASVTVRGFVSVEGDLSLVYEDVERSELAQWTRETFNRMSGHGSDSKLATTVAVPLAAGIATVIAPARSFKIEQLIQAAWRCLEGASSQGAGAVKTIEVY